MDVFKTLLLDTPDSLTNISGVLQVVNGGTGASTASGARTNLGLGTSAVLDAGAASGTATLGVDSKLTTSQIPDISVVDYLGSVASQAAMLALTGQKGDWCTRSDLGTNWIITGSPTTSIGSWTQLSYPTAPVTSVSGKTGAVTLASSDVGLGNVTNNAQTQAAIVPNTAPSSGQILVGNAGGTAYAPVSASGDVTVGSTGAHTLATVNGNVGSFGSATASPVVTVNGKGLVTAVSTSTITPAVGSITGLGTGVATALAINVGSAGAPVTNGGALGTPSSGTVTNLTGTASININGTVGATTPAAATVTSMNGGQLAGLRNKLINGDMAIDQANAGASVSVSSSSAFNSVDQFKASGSAAAGVFSVVQSQSTPPSGFTNFLRVTTTTASASPAAGEYYEVYTNIEGTFCQDLQLGSATAATFTISFQARSSLTGTFSGAIVNSANNRSYPFTFSIGSANTWTSISVTIVGDTTGTWLTTTGIGLQLRLDMGSGSNFRGSASSWSASNYVGVTSAVRVISTNAATFDLTGVQLELGGTATPFEYRPRQVELAMAQRYYSTSIETGATVTNFQTLNTTNVGGASGYSTGAGGDLFCSIQFPVSMRTTPSVTFYSGANRTAGSIRDMVTGTDYASFPNGTAQKSDRGIMYVSGAALTLGRIYGFQWVADARL